jgi:hypothetical protein
MTALGEMPDKANDAEPSTGLAAKLDRAESVLDAYVTPKSPLVARLLGLRERLRYERLHLAVLGQFKRGKSSFVNALLGAPLLPTAVVPLTAVATFISWRPEPLVRVCFRDGRVPEQSTSIDPDSIRDFLSGFVAEEANPQNHLGVARVELLYPAPILAGGTVLIDTPGVGSTFRHNTDAALQVLLECDAAFFVVSADPPITEVEIEYLRRARPKTARMFFILNKVDYLEPDEQRRVSEFLRMVLHDNGLCEPDTPIFHVSARSGLAAKHRNDRSALEQSGIAAVEDHLVRYLATEKTRSLEQAISSKAANILSQAAAEVALRRRALKMPLEELAAKTSAFEDALRSIEEKRLTTRDLLAGDRRRLVDNLEVRIRALREEASSKLAGVIDDSLSAAVPTAWEDTAQPGVSTAIEEVFEAARDRLASAFSTDAIGILSTHKSRIDALVDSVRHTAAEIFDVSIRSNVEQDSFQLGEEPYWVTESTGSTLIPDPGRAIDRLLPMRLRRARLRKRLVQETEELILRNAENLRWAILRGLDDTFRTAAAGLEERLDEAIAATKGVIEDAVARRRDQSFVIDPEVERLDRAMSALDAVVEEFAGDEHGNAVRVERQSH